MGRLSTRPDDHRRCPACGGYMHGVWSMHDPDEVVFHCIDCDSVEEAQGSE